MQIISYPLKFKKSIKILVVSPVGCKVKLEEVNRSVCLILVCEKPDFNKIAMFDIAQIYQESNMNELKEDTARKKKNAGVNNGNILKPVIVSSEDWKKQHPSYIANKYRHI